MPILTGNTRTKKCLKKFHACCKPQMDFFSNPFSISDVQDRNLRTRRYIVYGWPLRNKFIRPLGKQSLLTQNQCPCMQQIDKACVCVFLKE